MSSKLIRKIKCGIRALKYYMALFETGPSNFSSFGNNSVVSGPLICSNPHNIHIGDHVKIAPDSLMFATNAKIIIKDYFVSAKGLRIITGSHERRIGRFCASITENEKKHDIGLDADVVINEDVWSGMNVTILKGVTIGRGCTLAAGSVITKSIPPYSICGGSPARFIRFYWTVDEIMLHECQLYAKSDRYTREELQTIFLKYS